MRNRVALLRDIAIGAAGAVAVLLHLLAERWGTAAFAFAVSLAWIVVERRRWKHADLVITALFVVTGALLAWRLNEARLPLTVAGMWCLVAAADLSRLWSRFPVDSPPLDARLLLSRRLRHLGYLAAVSAAVVSLGRILTIQVRLPAVALLAVFVVVVLSRLIRSIAEGRLSRDDEEMSG